MSRPWMPLYVADYLADTGHLSTIEHGAYMLLIMHYWSKGGLPDDDKRLASIARASLEQWSDMRGTIAEFFGDGWKHERIESELENAAKAYERRAAAGKAGGKAKAEKASNATAMPEQSYSNHTHTHTHTHNKKEGAIAPKTRASKTDFEAWYQHYPHKVGRGQAEKAFVKAISLASLEELIAGVHRYIASKPADRQWQNPTTWLNGKGWLDAPAQLATAPPGRKRNYHDVAMDAFAGKTNGTEGIFGNNGDAQRLPARRIESRPDDGNLQSGIGRRVVQIDH